MRKARLLFLALCLGLFSFGLSAQYQVTTGTGSFIDISGSGNALNLGDDGTATINIPFAFTFFGDALPSNIPATIDNNGRLLYNVAGGGSDFSNESLPDNTPGDPIIAPFWDDLDSDQGNVFWEVQGDAPNRVLIVQWNMRPHFPGPGNTGTIQLQMYETTHVITFFYEDVDFGDAAFDNGASATIGMQENGTGDFELFSFNTASVSDGFSITYDDPADDIIDDGIDPVYEIQVSSITEVNVTLNEDCEALLTPRQVLVGDFDVDGDGETPPDDQFQVIVQDENPENGPIIDGCGRYIYTVSAIDEEPDTTNGFVDEFDVFGPNWGFFLGTVPGAPFDPNSQTLNITVFGTELLRFATLGDNFTPGGNNLFQGIGELQITEPGMLSF
ncbi:MAG: hypothetical protein AAFU67_16350, partial [Bacteroidota bacterium]